MGTRVQMVARVMPAVLLMLSGAGEVDAEPRTTRWSLQLEGGSEYDSNAHRLELSPDDDAPVEGAPVARAGARLRLRWKPKATEQLSFSGFGGTKLFGTDTSQGENVLVTSGDARYEHMLPTRKAILGARGVYYEAFAYRPFGGMSTPSDGRNFSLGDAQLSLDLLGPKGHRFSISGGYAKFRYKPDADFDWQGDKWGASYRATFWRGNPDEDLDAATIDLTFGYGITRRMFRGRAFTNVCGPDEPAEPRCFSPSTIDRSDLYHAAATEVVYTGDRIWSARYTVSVTDSNSYGQSLVRQRLELGMTTETWSDVFLTAKVALQLDTFLDPLLLARDVQSQSFVTIDDENRNSLSVHLAKDVSNKWSVEARYALFSNEFATRKLNFRRQIFYSGAVYRYR